MSRFKTLCFAYESSPRASKLNKGKGCWLVDDDSGLPPFVYQEREMLQALEMFEDIEIKEGEYSFNREKLIERGLLK